MADRIKLLPDAVANQIAAGEVVNRPSSVVKELMENAVDAGARNVAVNFREGGRALIQVVDDGVGMSRVDARLAFDRHATSKIGRVDDIYSLTSFGFRGEALASIASVAEVELRTRPAADELGTKVEINGGKFASQTNVNCPAGSQFVVKNLFYNVPARRRFLEKSTTESRHIVAEYQRVALCNPSVAFALYDNDAPLSRLDAGSLRQRVVGVMGRGAAKNLLDVGADTSIVRIEGFTGRPASARHSGREQFLFVNGRYFKSPYFHKAVMAAYEKLTPAGAQPSYFLYLTIDPGRIDVNVHPQKTEVKFEDGSEVWQIVNAAVRESLARSGAVPAMDFDMDTSVEIPVYRESEPYRIPTISGNPDFNPFDKYAAGGEAFDGADISDFIEGYSARGGGGSTMEFTPAPHDAQTRIEIDAERGAVPAFSVGRRYIAACIDGSLTVVDARRAREVVLYDRYMAMLAGGNSMCQRLLFPLAVTLSGDDAALMREHAGDLAALGFEIAPRDDHSFDIGGVPADLPGAPGEDMIYDLIDALRDEAGGAAEIKRRRLAAAMSRMGASSGPAPAGDEETAALLDALLAVYNYSFTPSGAPVMFTMGEEEIAEKLRK